MTTSIIITLSVLLLLAYLFDITASKTKVPSVMMLLLMGFVVKALSEKLGIEIPNLNEVLPLLGTVGLILIVLEGALELEINRSKMRLILNASLIALIPLLLVSIGIALYFNHFEQVPLKSALANAIPIGIISSAIAIPSAKNLIKDQKEFITYESSLSDIFGVLFFNFIVMNDDINSTSFMTFSFELILMLVISFVATLLLALLLGHIKHHIKYLPLVILVILIYAISKVFHLPALIFILLFGLFVGNIDELRNLKFINRFHPENFSAEVHKFKEITTELAFLVRALFFILFGFLLKLSDILNTSTIIPAIGFTAGIFLLRWIVLKLFKYPANPLVYIAPRGLITILLFLSIPASQRIIQVDQSLITQMILLSALVMMFGLMKYKKPLTPSVDESNPTI
jgi:cell volume regulation protein A